MITNVMFSVCVCVLICVGAPLFDSDQAGVFVLSVIMCASAV